MGEIRRCPRCGNYMFYHVVPGHANTWLKEFHCSCGYSEIGGSVTYTVSTTRKETNEKNGLYGKQE